MCLANSRQAKAALVLMSYAIGPNFPDLCMEDVSIEFSAEQNWHFTLSLLANPYCFSSRTLASERGP
jgi:hypothetical protein